MPRLSSRFSRFVGLLALPSLATCSDLSPVAPIEPPEPAAEVAKLQCTVTVRASSLTCASAAPAQGTDVRGAVRILGIQGFYVRLTSSGVSYDAQTGILRADVTVQNLLGQLIGTPDGTTPDTVRVFFESGPTRTVGSGSVEVANEHGTGTFTRSSQPYFNYPGILTTEQTSAPVEWQFSLPQTVETFVFTVYVWAPVPEPAGRPVHIYHERQIAVGAHHACALRRGYMMAYCWGSNEHGQLGNNQPESGQFWDVPGFLDSVSAGRFHTCGYFFDNIFCWGDNEAGQLGVEGPDSPAPVRLPGDSYWFQVDAGARHTCGLKYDGYDHSNLFCWGDGLSGQLGTGDSASTSTPGEVRSVAWWGMVEAGTYHTCGVTGAGAAYCWGDNSAGQLGRPGPSTARPVVVGGNHSWAAVSAGEDFSCGITSTGAAMCWGSDSEGQLGNGAAPSGTTPVAVLGDRKWVQISTGRKTACGVTTDGKGYCWGSNKNGEIGDGTTTSRNAPQEVSRSTAVLNWYYRGGPWAWIVAGEDRTCAINAVGEGHCWGYNSITGKADLTPSWLGPSHYWSATPRQRD
ncbi:MAG TPA: hypothetical protein VGB15_13910 [Longimicrobium sp.]|jgi:alpha-tubulin suppressor-like RCC1 family protein